MLNIEMIRLLAARSMVSIKQGSNSRGNVEHSEAIHAYRVKQFYLAGRVR
ncbi:hypothetical protein X740_16860 [Mesorhizobium sp. LNHC221B00]|nr:hypothetical protein X740_16860 [Mesorhizobium sp. LNHC221B00]